MNVRISRRASRQVDVIHRYLSEQRLSAATTFLDAFFQLRMQLDAFPRSAPVIRAPHLHQASLVGFPYVATYRVTKGEVIILGVFHTSRDPMVRTRP